MSTILALDTTSANGSLALYADGHVLAEQLVQAPDGFAHVLFPAIESLLANAGRRLAEVDCFAATSGPGSFTGLRVGLAAVKGLAEAEGKPCAAVSNLRVLASAGTGSRRATVLDARRGQVFAAVYDANLKLVAPEVVAGLAGWLETVTGVTSFVAPAAFHPAIAQRYPGALVTYPRSALAPPLARVVELDGPIAWVDPVAVDANYVRRSDAELFWREPQP